MNSDSDAGSETDADAEFVRARDDLAFDELTTDASFTTIDTHTEGEPTRIVVGGIDRSAVTGDSVRERRDSFAETHDWVRDLLMREPRGHDDMFGAVVVDADHSEADVGVFFMDSRGYLDMCGHGTIGVVSALLELGRLDRRETVRVETPAGLVEATPEYAPDGGVERVTIQNVRSFVYDEVTVPVPFLDSPLRVDVVYAGNFFALVDSDQLDRPVEPQHAATFVDWGLEIRDAVNERLDIVHPLTGEEGSVSITEIYSTPDEVDRSIVVFGEGQVDRSPCGTGTCAKMALLHDAGALDIGESYLHESIVGTRFEGRLVAADERDGVTLTTPLITGSARITGKHTFVKDAKDSLSGFSISAE
ncbi:proline racemase family protein [Haloferax sulfurifontis]|uniref:Proline racemase n=1 Tax=Haloferax sulfurifontis TaxID=255616 RepID=A0A830E3X9_9EURY|nr:proline racemase family protein [Haloferax sulfurifontis]GGC66999.1 proline racemase [Haloferax sulfurifontis]